MKELNLALDDKQLACKSSDDGILVWPAEWEDELSQKGFLDAAMSLLVSCDPKIVEVPWIIGSASRTLFGTERTDSPSHAEGKAFDMSPMYSPDAILSPDKRISGMAWNIMSIAAVAPMTSTGIPFCVEGDHIHVQPSISSGPSNGQSATPSEGDPSRCIYCAFTGSTWYPWFEQITAVEPAKSLIPSLWAFNLDTAEFKMLDAEGARRMKIYLEGS